uniref:Photosynthesis system II assembly factor Ycf48/Hcf136-like domain-containing protein n=1 Tax=Schlesneria paludicola TaxID=360056 RepID=A0A7C2JZH1_9PLAN
MDATRAVGIVLAMVSAGPLLATDTPQPWHDDATLHDVQFVGSRAGYAVGDHGTVWKTVDGGQSWTFVPTPVTASLRSASFLTDQLGWVVGHEEQPYAQLPVACVLATTDGGATWNKLPADRLPGLSHVRFFTPDVGVAVGQPGPQSPAGVYRTTTGGRDWTPLSGDATTAWQAARFLSPDLGVVAGRNGQLSLIGGEQLLASRLPPLPHRTIYDVTLTGNETGWLVGDGGLVLTTSTGGVVWQSPPAPLPEELRHHADFRCVEQRGDKVWIAGRPGSVIWHSPDAGHSWRAQPTGQTAPIERLRFTSESVGVAVGVFGSILRTEDGGETWRAVRAANRRAAWLAIAPQPAAWSPLTAAQWTADEGYRGVVWAVTDDPAPHTHRLSGAMHLARGNEAEVDWRLPLDEPDLARSGERLLEAWQKRAENRAPELIVNNLVRQIRTWRPEVIVVPLATERDALSQFTQQAVQAAIAQAADPTRALEQQELVKLAAWKAPRVVTVLPTGSRGEWTLDPHTLLPRLGRSSSQQAAAAAAWLGQRAILQPVSFRAAEPGATGTSVFAGLSLSPGSEARRPLAALDEAALLAAQKQAQARRNFLAVAERTERNGQTAAQLVAQAPNVLRDMSAGDGAAFLAELARTYRHDGRFDLAESTYLELVRRYSNEPAALEAMRWLLPYWTSAEVAWQRTKSRGAVAQQATNDVSGLPQRIQQAGGLGASVLNPPESQAVIPARAVTAVDRALANRRNHNPAAPPDSVDEWRSRAVELAQQLEEQAPLLFEQPEIQFPLAALRRTKGSAAQADAVYRRLHAATPDAATRQILDRELWLGHGAAEAPRHLVVSRSTPVRPHLDGLLSDSCWQDARELLIGPTSDDEAATPTSLVMLAHDKEFLYVAASFDRQPSAPNDRPDFSDREHDADLAGFDRMGIALDVDRDYATWYEFQVDQRGQTRDRCWEDAAWDPQWYVAVDADAQKWRIELAIPWSELAPLPPQFREVWGVSLTRIIPFAAVQSWSPPAAWPPRWNSFGLVRFE